MKRRGKIIRIGMQVYPGCLRSSAVMPAAVLHVAGTLSGLRAAAQQVRFEVRWFSARKERALTIDSCGYEDVSTFSKVFKRWARVTPREYRVRFGLRQ
jgi:hypothetical protein